MLQGCAGLTKQVFVALGLSHAVIALACHPALAPDLRTPSSGGLVILSARDGAVLEAGIPCFAPPVAERCSQLTCDRATQCRRRRRVANRSAVKLFSPQWGGPLGAVSQ